MIEKIIKNGEKREEEMKRMEEEMKKKRIEGIVKNSKLMQEICNIEDLRKGDVDKGMIGREKEEILKDEKNQEIEFEMEEIGEIDIMDEKEKRDKWQGMSGLRMWGEEQRQVIIENNGERRKVRLKERGERNLGFDLGKMEIREKKKGMVRFEIDGRVQEEQV